MKEFNNIWNIFYEFRFVIVYAVIFIVATILLIRFLYKKKAAGIFAINLTECYLHLYAPKLEFTEKK